MLGRLKRMSRGGWIACGIIVGVVIAPGAALAAFSDVRVVGIFGSPPAAVTAAHQLRVTEIDPANIRRTSFDFASFSQQCLPFPAPAGSALMLKQLSVDVYSNPSPGVGDAVGLYATTNCTDLITSVTPSSTGVTVIPFEPGIAIRSGGGFSLLRFGDVLARVNLLAYTMPANAVPASTQNLSRSSKSSLRKP